MLVRTLDDDQASVVVVEPSAGLVVVEGVDADSASGQEAPHLPRRAQPGTDHDHRR